MSAAPESPPSLVITTSAKEFFHEQVVAARERQRLALSENVEFYLVNLLCEFVSIDASVQDECFALILSRALEAEFAESVVLYKRLGDTSLYFAGMFQGYFNRKSFDVGYYVAMGENAFGQLSSLMRARGKKDGQLAQIYGEMSAEFRTSVDLLLDISEHTGLTHEPSRSTLALYEAWLATASSKLEQQLYERNVIPIPVRKKIFQ